MNWTFNAVTRTDNDGHFKFDKLSLTSQDYYNPNGGHAMRYLVHYIPDVALDKDAKLLECTRATNTVGYSVEGIVLVYKDLKELQDKCQCSKSAVNNDSNGHRCLCGGLGHLPYIRQF